MKDHDQKFIGFVDKKGKIVILAIYSQAQNFSDGIAAVSTDGISWGYIDKKGKKITPEKYTISDYEREIDYFSNGYCLVHDPNYKINSFIILDKSGKEFKNKKYEIFSVFNEGLVAVQDNTQKFGFINKAGS